MMSSNNQIPSLSMLLDKVAECHEKLAKNLFLEHRISEENIFDDIRVVELVDEGSMQFNFTCQFEPEFLQKYNAEFDIRMNEIGFNYIHIRHEFEELAELFEAVILNQMTIGMQNARIGGMENSQQSSTVTTDYQFMTDDLGIMVNHFRNIKELQCKRFNEFIDFIEEKAQNKIPKAIEVSSDCIRMFEPEMHFTPSQGSFRYTLNWPVQKALERLRSSTMK